MKRILITVILGLSVTTTYSQNFWQKGGNAQFPPFAPSSLGTNASWNAPLEIMTNGIQRIHINENIGTTSGFVGIGTNFLGPNHLLDVFNGDINTGNGTPASPTGYMIGDNYVLRHNAIISNIYVGVDAGNNFSNGIQNTFVGNKSGMANTSGYSNTFVGANAGLANTTGIFNTFLGENAGLSNTTADGNTFLGRDAGRANTTGEFNTFVGDEAGQHMTTGTGNTFVGHHAGWHNISGDANCFFGYHDGAGPSNSTGSYNSFLGTLCGANVFTGDYNVMAGYQSGRILYQGARNVFLGSYSGRFTYNGSDNVFIGFRSAWANNNGEHNIVIGTRASSTLNLGTNSIFIGDNCNQSAAGLNNAIVLGSNAIVTGDNNMILGDNNINAGIGLSGDPLGPQNKLEINFSVPGDFNTPNPGSGTGFSGLRFRDLTSYSIPYTANPGDGVLSVDQDGNVILVPDNGGGSNMDYDWEHITPLGVFSGHPNTGGFNDQNVFAGFTPAQLNLIPFPTKFAAFSDFGALGNLGQIGSITGYFLNSYNQPVLNSRAAAVVGMANGNRCGIKYTENYGGFFLAENAETNFGGYFYAGCCDSPYNGPTYGIWATTGHCAGSNAGYFDGDVTVMGTFSNPSDILIKENVVSMPDILNKIQQLNPVEFNFKNNQYPQLGLPTGSQFGFIAQELELIFPELVTSHHTPQIFDLEGNLTRDSITLKEIDYLRIVPIAIEGIKELKSQNDSLKNIIASYENRFASIEDILSQCCVQTKSSQTDVNATILISPDATMGKQTQLYQNRPNPFNVKTTFAYTLGESGNVELIIEDGFGRMVTSLVNENQEPGEYSVDWNAENITPGIYFYSLRVNGIVLVKKAIKF